jgi:hypothetical protein
MMEKPNTTVSYTKQVMENYDSQLYTCTLQCKKKSEIFQQNFSPI